MIGTPEEIAGNIALDVLGAVLPDLAKLIVGGQVSPEQAIAAARQSIGPDPFANMAAEDAARRARLTASARVLRGATVPPALLTPDVEAALRELLDHHDPLGAEHEARAARADEVTTEIKVP